MSTCTLAQAAALDFQPIRTDGLMPRTMFEGHSRDVYATMAIADRLLALGPSSLASTLLAINPGNPVETVVTLSESREWLQGLVDVLECVEARAVCALSRRAVADE